MYEVWTGYCVEAVLRLYDTDYGVTVAWEDSDNDCIALLVFPEQDVPYWIW